MKQDKKRRAPVATPQQQPLEDDAFPRGGADELSPLERRKLSQAAAEAVAAGDIGEEPVVKKQRSKVRLELMVV